jgi:hypothetical protein
MQVRGPSRAMMTNSLLKYVLSCFLLFFIGAARLQGQARDFQSWWELELNKKITGRLDLNGEFQQRFRNNSLQYDRSMMTLGASYDVLDYLKLGGAARLALVMDGEQQLQTRYRIHLDASGGYDILGFDLSLRLRFQYGFEDFSALNYFSASTIVERNQLKVQRHIYGTRIDWFASFESFHGSIRQSNWRTYAFRYSAGAKYSLNFRSRLSLRYVLYDELNVPAPQLLNIISAGYAYDL